MDISQAFADLNSKFVETVNSHDAHRWAAPFSEDAVLVPFGQPSVSGRNRIEEWGEIATKVRNHLEIQQGRCSSDGNVVWQQGTWTWNINLPDHQTTDISGNFLIVAEKEGSPLRIKAHTWNVNPTTQWPTVSNPGKANIAATKWALTASVQAKEAAWLALANEKDWLDGEVPPIDTTKKPPT